MDASPTHPGRTIGLDLGGTKCLGLVLDRDGAVVDEERVRTPKGQDAVADALGDVAEVLLARTPGVVAVGVGAPGLVDRAGTLRFAPNLPGIVDAPLAVTLSTRLGLPVAVDNDATCATAAEHALGAARGAHTAVLVTLGTGIGGGLVTGGTLLRGANGFAGEPGHMVVDPDGPPCPCGRRGCWERYASGSGLGRLAREAAVARRARRVLELAGGDPEAVRGEHVTTAAREGDAEAGEIVEQFAWWLALGLANVANLLDPDVVVVGGGLVQAADLLLDPVRRHFAELVLAAPHRPPVSIVPAVLGERAGGIGAALIARRAE